MGFGGWVCMNCVAGLGVVRVGNKKWVWWLGLCELCRQRGCGEKKLLVLMCRGRDSSLFMEGLEVLWK